MPKAPQQHGLPNIGTGHAVAQRHKVRERRGTSRERGYTAAWSKFSRTFLRANPLCEYCLGKGITQPARVTDHDLPHEGNPDLFWDNTFTALCTTCHSSTKQQMEARYKGKALLDAIRRAKAGLTDVPQQSVTHVRSAGAMLIWGPPAAGKTTFARSLARETGAVIYDLDDSAEKVGLPRYGRTKDQASIALKEMRRALGSHNPARKLILVTTAPTRKRRDYWAKLISAESAYLVVEPENICLQRAKQDPERRKHYKQQEEIIKRWFHEAE